VESAHYESYKKRGTSEGEEETVSASLKREEEKGEKKEKKEKKVGEESGKRGQRRVGRRHLLARCIRDATMSTAERQNSTVSSAYDLKKGAFPPFIRRADRGQRQNG